MPPSKLPISILDSSTPPFISRQVEQSRLFFLESGAMDFQVTCGGFERCRSDYRIDRDGLEWFCLEFVSRGNGRLKLGESSEILTPGSIFIHGPGTPHCIETDHSAPLSKYFVSFTGTAAEQFLSEFDLLPGFIANCLKLDAIRSSFELLIERGMRKSEWVNPLCTAITRQLLLLCKDESVQSGNMQTAAFATYLNAKERIEKNYLNFATLDAVAADCGTDAPYLCRLFARFHDESPYQYLTRLRMGHAATLLLDKNLGVREASQILGYKDAFHFSRVFKSIHQVPPSRFKSFRAPSNPTPLSK